MRAQIVVVLCAVVYVHALSFVTETPEVTVNYHEEIEKCNSEEEQTTFNPNYETATEFFQEIFIQPVVYNDTVDINDAIIARYEERVQEPQINEVIKNENNTIVNETHTIEVLKLQQEKYNLIINQYKDEFNKLLEIQRLEKDIYEKRISKLEALIRETRFSSEQNEDSSSLFQCPCMRAKRNTFQENGNILAKLVAQQQVSKTAEKITKQLVENVKVDSVEKNRDKENEDFFKYMEEMNLKHLKAVQEMRQSFKELYEKGDSSEDESTPVTSDEIKSKIQEMRRKYALIAEKIETRGLDNTNVDLNIATNSSNVVEVTGTKINTDINGTEANINVENTLYVVPVTQIENPNINMTNGDPILTIPPPAPEIPVAKVDPVIKVNSTQAVTNNTKLQMDTGINLQVGASFNLTDGFKVHWKSNWPKTGPVNNRPVPNGGYIPKV